MNYNFCDTITNWRSVNSHTTATFVASSAAYFTEKAAQCRRLAASVTDDLAAEKLLELAEKYEVLAAKCASREDSEKAD
jgi:hypothetical protein